MLEGLKRKMQIDISKVFMDFIQDHTVLEILPMHAKVLSIDRNISIRVGKLFC